jgi:O-6-methylguanine DNA methyltransferase
VRQANRLRNRVDEGSNGVAAAASERQDNCDMHGLLWKEKLVQNSKEEKLYNAQSFLIRSGETLIEVYVKNSGCVWLGVAFEEQRVCATSFGDDEIKVVKGMQEILSPKLPLEICSTPSGFAQNVLSVMKDVYEGRGFSEKVPLVMEGLPVYTQRVLGTVSQIPVGYVASYGGVAEAAGGGARAVGNVMANNQFAPIVPCHRVVTSSLGLGGYGGGLKIKFEFLNREKRGYTELLDVSVDGGILRVFPVEFVLRKLEKSVAWNRRRPGI